MSEPRLLAGGPIAAQIREGLLAEFTAFRARWGYAPTLAVVLVGADAPSAQLTGKGVEGLALAPAAERIGPRHVLIEQKRPQQQRQAQDKQSNSFDHSASVYHPHAPSVHASGRPFAG